MSYITDRLDAAADEIRNAMVETSFVNHTEWLNLRDNVVPKLDAIRARLHLAEHDDRRAAP